MQLASSARGRWLRRAGAAAGLALLAVAGVAIARRPLGPNLLEVTGPDTGATLPNQAVEVFIGFPHADRTLHETLEVRLNGADVTGAFTVAGNGAFGSVVLIVDGENELRVGVFGRSWWPGGRLFEHHAVVRFRVLRAIDVDWA
jgi:hypothetical protein